MTDTFHPAPTIASHAPPHYPSNTTSAFARDPRYGAPVLDGVHEDDGQISCICGFADDDGNTVACDACNRWQHTICYWPEYEGQELPEELQHYCVECQPRDFDAHAANARQRLRREQQDLFVNGAKRQAAKSHKKKIKDPAGPGYTNGWPLDKVKHDRNSASPRDQPPPAKRPKTRHRASESVTNASTKGHSRKRNASSANHSRSLSQSPETSYNVYSPEFVQCYKEDDWAVTNTNLHNDIAVTNALSEWLRAPDDVFRDTHGLEKTEVLMRWDGELDDIPGKAELAIQPMQDTAQRDDDGEGIRWKIITVKEPVAPGAYIGELKGHVGFKDQYKGDPQNRWSQLRHPEPFVFFHPRLPLYIDARHEGTGLRYVRRSCTPNARLQILVTDSTDYRFCFMATELIDPGMEVAVGWDTSDSVMHRTSTGMTVSMREMGELSTWVSTVLSNCGPCACPLPPTECYMSRFDRRAGDARCDEHAPSVKMPKAKKKRPGQHISPLDTHAVNSRSGSEARKADLEEEPSDSRSASGSGRGSASRDITPNTHYSANGSSSAMPELSERERKKLAKEEEMFRRQEEERTGKQSKKKRNSAGSTANTPGASSSKQFGASKYADAGTSSHTGLSLAKTGSGKRPKSVTGHQTPARSVIRTVKRPKPSYVDAETQCDMDREEAARHAASPQPRRTYISITQRLLQRCAMNNARLKASNPVSGQGRSPKVPNAMDGATFNSTSPLNSQIIHPPGDPRDLEPVPKREFSNDVHMQDASVEHQATRSPLYANKSALEPPRLATHGLDDVFAASHSPVDPPAPPWISKVSPSVSDGSVNSPQLPQKPTDMHLQMPPPPSNPFAGPPSSLSAGTPNGITGTMIQSPASLVASGPMFSPAVTAAVNPSPARKKLSLSDYTKRSKAKDKDFDARTDRESSPASVASGPIVPPLQASASEARTAEDGSAIDEDVRMDDAGVDASTS